jgi:putative ABC transport system ATP-binding protein
MVTPLPAVTLRGVTRTYPGPPPLGALQPCNLSIGRGEYVTVAGPSGSGKSTLLNLIGLLDGPTEGTYELDGVDTGALPERDRTALRARRIGFVFQAFHLLPRWSAAENIMLGMVYTGVPHRRRGALAWELLSKVGLAHRATAPAGQLSGGERQRVAIARALANRPSLLLCDEPTGNLDSANSQRVLGLLDDLHRDGITVIVVTHDVNVAAHGQRTIRILDGVVA